ncbi:MAG: ATP-grasp domain-containing protein, partial [Desulfohalobiaceae bacterium]
KRILLFCDASDIEIVDKSFAQELEFEMHIETFERILDYGVAAYLQRSLELIQENPGLYQGIVGTHDSSAILASILAEQAGHVGPSVQSIINTQNKYLCRRIQQNVIPEHIPGFCLALDYLQNQCQLKCPFFIKPVRANISFGTHLVNSAEELQYYIGQESRDIAYYNQYYLDALSQFEEYQNPLNLETCNNFLCEELVHGEQVTVDGFIHQGQVHIFGLTKACYYPGTNSFSHHVFPYSFSPELDAKIEDALCRLIPALGMNNTFFNVELRAEPEKNSFKIIEVNSRIAFQFAKTIQAVRGFDPLRLLCELAVGRSPDLDTKDRQTFRYCFNFELHTFSDKRILRTPTQSGYTQIQMLYPEVHVRNLIQEHSCLSDYKHNPQSFRYCVLDVPGDSEEEILRKKEHIVSLLNYEFQDLN